MENIQTCNKGYTRRTTGVYNIYISTLAIVVYIHTGMWPLCAKFMNNEQSDQVTQV